jgi:2-(1,2-epoxy-1,2-dihydrophenyl)acetyl-CoA isomerase
MKHLIIEKTNSIQWIYLNRPDVLNALNSEMLFELQDAFKQAEDDSVRCVVLTAKGKGFCSGQDLKDFEKEKKSFKEALETKYNPLIEQIHNLQKPVICGINGVAAGAGLSLALACDYRIAVESAQLIEIFINVGLVPDSGSHFTLPRIVGLAKSFDLCATGKKLSAFEAYRLGLVNFLVSDNEVLKIALTKFSKKFSKLPTNSVGMIKKALSISFSYRIDEILKLEAEYQDIAGNSNDYKEGVNSFLEKRKPDFKGN